MKAAFSEFLFPLTLKIHERSSLTFGLSAEDQALGRLLPSDWNKYPSQIVLEKTKKSIRSRGSASYLRMKQVEFYNKYLCDICGGDCILPKTDFLSHYPIRTSRKNELVKFLWNRGVFVSSNLYNRLLCHYKWVKTNSSDKFIYPNARDLISTTVHLPLYDSLTESQQLEVVNLIAEFVAS